MKRTGIAVLGGLVLLVFLPSCGGGEPEGEGGTSLALKLEDGAEATPAGPTVPETGPAEASGSASATPSAESKPDLASAGASADALLALDAWHRAPLADRDRKLQGEGAATAALRDFARIWEGGAAAYRAQLEVKPVTVFGPDFERFSKALAKAGTVGLQKELKRGGQGPAYLVWNDALVQMALKEQDLATAGEFSGRLLARMLSAGYDRERVLGMKGDVDSLYAQAASFLPAEDYKVQPNDSYWKICRDFRKQEVDAYRGWIAHFNGKSSYNLREGERLRIPTATLHMEAWRQARIAALYADGVPIRLYSISVGKSDSPTPTGDYTLDICEKEPMWYPPEGGSIPYGHPDNPLGERWLGFKEKPAYAFHGNNSPDTLGGFESEGCIRMANDAVIELFELVGPGVKVKIHP